MRYLIFLISLNTLRISVVYKNIGSIFLLHYVFYVYLCSSEDQIQNVMNARKIL